MASSDFITRLAESHDANAIVEISGQVQAALTASGSLQEIGPLRRDTVSNAIDEARCLVAETSVKTLLGCAFIRSLENDHYARSSDFNINSYPEPWWFLHSIMLAPEFQGKGIGLRFFVEVVGHLRRFGGTLLLDCWAGNDKLRAFYARAGCTFVATLPEHDYEIAVFVKDLTNASESLAFEC